MKPTPMKLPLALLLALVLAPGMSPPVHAQGPGAGPVNFTEAVDYTVRQIVQLPGAVESKRDGLVASEVPGLVVALPVREGDLVEKNQTLVRLRDVTIKLQLRAAEGDYAEAKARRALARSQLDRARELFASEVVSQDDLDDAVSEHTAWSARVDRNEAEVERLKVALYRTVIRAPYAGVVTERYTEVGQWIEQGGAAVAMVSLDTLEVRVDAPERFYDLLEIGTEATVEFESIPGAARMGRVERIIPRADPQARSFPVKVGIDNADGRIAIGMLARVALPVGEPRRELLVPKDSVMQNGTEHSIYRIKPDDTVEPVRVLPGQGVGDWVVIRGPVEAGQRIVTRGNERLQPGQSVRAQHQAYPPPPAEGTFRTGG